ncbi:HlyC/CorC family transporter [Enterovirga rhinocerotis]|uniref:Mg2+/Co2+ transporter CorB n=1 Tax=Enterovirga rhinocerotis TaxID=1339210 RepID=A0A4R7C5S1_9HYPH|nr:transporter associated domain-containing protein [Enterovirga rhinocerotis]TDR93561.1 Mg2+/Co2+ transporter CorB [Enterovirga rhinocerotis]
MPPDIWQTAWQTWAPWQIAALVCGLLAAAALLSAIRLTLARASRPDPESSEGQTGVRRALPLRARVLGALFVGNILLNTAAAVIAATALIAILSEQGFASAAGVAIGVVSLAAVLAEALARLAARAGCVERVFGLVGLRLENYAQKLSFREEIRGRLDLLDQDGDVPNTERQMLGGLLDLGEMTVFDVMIHRTKMRTIDAELPVQEVVREVLASPYTRLPVFRGTPDNIIGVLHAKDLFRAIEGRRERARIDIEAVASPPWFVPDTTSLRDQLSAFLAKKQHFALVVDEYGDLMGLVTLEDILEEIVGEIGDEHDVAARGVRPQADGSLLVDGSVPVRDLNRMMGWALPDEEATTVAGLVIHEAQAIPEAGQAFTFHGFRFEVLRRMRNRIVALRVSRLPASDPVEPVTRPRAA